MKLKEQLDVIQEKIDLVNIYQELITLDKIPLIKELEVSKKAKQKVLDEVVSFARSRIKEIEGGSEVVVKEKKTSKVPEKSGIVSRNMPLQGKKNDDEELKEVGIVAGDRGRIVAIGDIQPENIKPRICTYDLVRVVGIEGDMARVKHATQGFTFLIPTMDIEKGKETL